MTTPYAAIIANGGTESTTLNIDGSVLVGFFTAPTMTGTAITFETQTPLGAWVNIEDGAGNDLTVTVSGGEYVYLNPSNFANLDTIRFVSGSAEGAERALYASIRAID